MSKMPEFKPIPTQDVESLLNYNDDIGAHTYGMWVVRAVENPELVLVTRGYNAHIPMLPSWLLRESMASWRGTQNLLMHWNQTDVEPKNTEVLPLYSNAPINDRITTEGTTYLIMPLIGEASVKDERRPTAEWYEYRALAATLQEKMAGNSLYAPYMQLCIGALRHARQHIS